MYAHAKQARCIASSFQIVLQISLKTEFSPFAGILRVNGKLSTGTVLFTIVCSQRNMCVVMFRVIRIAIELDKAANPKSVFRNFVICLFFKPFLFV